MGKKQSRETGRLSAQTVKAAKAGLHHDGGGLYLQVTDTGARSWLFRYSTGTSKKRNSAADGQVDGAAKPKSTKRERWMGLGPVSIISLRDARIAAADCRRQRWTGKDPIEERKAAKLAAQLERAKAVTFRAAAELCIAAMRAGWRNEKHSNQWAATLEAYAYPVFGDLPVQDVDVTLVMKAIEPVWTTKPETASRVRGRIESVLDWAAARGYRKGDNPARWKGHIENLLPKRSKVAKVAHHPALPYDEIGVFIQDLRRQAGEAAGALEFTILCASRTGEVIGARPEEFNVSEKVWIIPAERMKVGREHRVPLSEAALAIVKKRIEGGGAYVFAGGKKGKPLSNMALLKVLERMGRDDLTVHGFRSTFRDWAAERTNFPRDVAEMALAHTIGDKVEAAYRRGDLFEKRRQIMRAWADWCSKAGRTKSNVVAIQGAA
jgi:integrase